MAARGERRERQFIFILITIIRLLKWGDSHSGARTIIDMPSCHCIRNGKYKRIRLLLNIIAFEQIMATRIFMYGNALRI